MAQTPRSVERLYGQAAAQPSGPQRIAGLESVAERAAGTPLRIEALELLVWEYAHSNAQQAGVSARELLAIDEANPLAIAVLKSGTGIDQRKTSSPQQRQLEILVTTLRSVPALRRPRAISGAEFATMQRWCYALLSGAVGMAYFDSKEYSSARSYLQNALAVMPDNAAWNYTLAITDLNDDSPESQSAFLELARAVILSEGTGEGQQIARFAVERYKAAGGTPADWNRYLDSARATVANSSRTTVLPHIALANSDIPIREPRISKMKESKANSDVRKQERQDASLKNNENRNADRLESNTGVEEITGRATPKLDKPLIKPFPPGEPVSLGILLEASIKKENRDELVQGLSDVVRRLRPKDEAFVLAFGNQLAFEQDLTQNYRLLERAVDEIKPESGTALYEAVGFAAGHLKRIAKNSNQALLVISDGRNSSNRESSLRLASELSNVKVYCIGVGAGSTEGNYALQSLASYTGGRVAFVASPDQFEPVLQSIAAVIYGPYSQQQSRR